MTKQTDYAVAPGEFLAEWLEETSTTQQEAAHLYGCSRKHINEIVNGRAPVTPETALKLERLTGIAADSWLRFEARYRLDLARLQDAAELAQHAAKVPANTAKYLRALGVTKATQRNPGQLVADLLGFHRCGTWESFENGLADATQGEFALAALTESKTRFDQVACATWLRAGETTAAFEHAQRLEYDPEKLRALLPALRQRAASPDASLLSDLADLLAGAGVTFMMLNPPDGLPLYGMTRWINKRVPVIQQSGRRAKDGFIIWTFFHELGHVLNDPRGQTHFEFKNDAARTSAAEKNANNFAYAILFGDGGMQPFAGASSDRAIADVAKKVGVSPGVAVHQLHRRRMLDYSHGNRLFVELEWASDESC